MKKEILIREFLQKVWNEKNFDCIPEYVAPKYKIIGDSSDPWNGRTLNYEEYAMRLDYYYDTFPDIYIEFQIAMADANAVKIIWNRTGTNSRRVGVFQPTGKSIRTTGSTIYHFNDGKICGHLQT